MSTFEVDQLCPACRNYMVQEVARRYRAPRTFCLYCARVKFQASIERNRRIREGRALGRAVQDAKLPPARQRRLSDKRRKALDKLRTSCRDYGTHSPHHPNTFQ